LLLWPFYSVYEASLSAQVKFWQVPQHVGIIMDGNRRFARSFKLGNIINGHERGAAKLEEVLNWCEETGVRVVTVWIFSMDNFNRDPEEVDGLMNLFEKKFLEMVSHPRIHRDEVRVRFIGNIDALPESVRKAIRTAEEATAHHNRRVLNVGVAYGGREEIVEAFRNHFIAEAGKGKSIGEICDALQPGSVEPYLYTSHVPDPDLIIRTSGEVRLSGFLLWQSAYSEYYFCDSNWPAFRRIDFLRALREYSLRQRRFGR
jgi:short-chain Z-isoprenyl diphosphate synthase